MKEYNKCTDQQLMGLLKGGNHAAYLEIYDRYKTPLQQHAYKKLGHAQDVQDVLQELFTDLWEKREILVLNTGLAGYLFTAVRNRSLNVIYRKRRESPCLDLLEELITEGSYTIDLQLREKEFAELIQKEIDALPPRMKEVFKMSRDEGLSHKEIAAILGTSETTVSKQITNVLKVLRTKLIPVYLIIFFLH